MARAYSQEGGGKGNKGMFIERCPEIIAAGLPTAQASVRVADHLQHYLLQDAVDALICDAIPPQSKSETIFSLKPQRRDVRNAGIFTETRDLINPEPKTKFQMLIEDFKSTAYKSYWKKSLGQVPDPVPMLPAGCDVQNTCFGKKTPVSDRLYDVVFPINSTPNQKSLEEPGFQPKRNYSTTFNPNATFGERSIKDTRGRYAKCCLTDDRITAGTCRLNAINKIQADYNASNQAKLGLPHTPNDNISYVSTDHTFGILKPKENLAECLTTYKMNDGRAFFMNCLKHLNTVRRALSKRFEPTFFNHFYLELKYYDADKTGWLEKEKIYDFCSKKHIRFNPALLEPLLEMWNGYDGSRIEYKTFIHVINYREPSPTIPKILDLPPDFPTATTTYNDMVKPEKKADERKMAGVPSARYIDLDFPIRPDGCCKADITNFPEESDARACLYPSVFTLYGISHRDMYANRSRKDIKRVFESAGEKFCDEKFNAVWAEAEKYHSQRWVSYATFKRALRKINNETIDS